MNPFTKASAVVFFKRHEIHSVPFALQGHALKTIINLALPRVTIHLLALLISQNKKRMLNSQGLKGKSYKNGNFPHNLNVLVRNS